MAKNNKKSIKKIKCLTYFLLIIGSLILIITPICYKYCYNDVPDQKLSTSKSVRNYELFLQQNISFTISIIANIPGESNEGIISFYMDKDSQSKEFNEEKEKITSLTILTPDGNYESFKKNFQEEFDNFLFKDRSIDFNFQYIPNNEFYPLIYFYYNELWITFVIDEPLKIPQKIILNENEINQAKENNTFITNTVFQLIAVGFSFIVASNVPLKIYLDMKKLENKKLDS